MLSRSLLIAVLCLIAACALAYDQSSARLMVYKYTDTSPVVEGEPMVIKYQLINLGESVATNIVLMDHYNPTNFKSDSALYTQTLDSLAPGLYHEFNVTVTPLTVGIAAVPRATVEFDPFPSTTVGDLEVADDETERRIVYSTTLGYTEVITPAKAASMKGNTKWIIFLSVLAIPTLLAYFNMNRSKDNNEKTHNKKKGSYRRR